MPLITTTPLSPVPVLPVYQSAVLADSPIGYYTLDETSGTDAFDTSGNGYTGAHNGPTVNQSPLITSGKAVSYDGTDETNLTATFPNPTGWTAVSLECWIKPTVVPTGGGTFLDDDYVIFVGNATFLLITRDGYVGFNIRNSADQYFGTAGTTILTPGSTYHVVGTYDGTDIIVYLNGVQNGINDFPGVGVTLAQNVAFTGFGIYGSGGRYYNGIIDEAAIYDSALTSTRVLAHYNAGI